VRQIRGQLGQHSHRCNVRLLDSDFCGGLAGDLTHTGFGAQQQISEQGSAGFLHCCLFILQEDPMTDKNDLCMPELLHWHVLHVIANHEKRVALQLSLRSIEHYLPLYAERSRWSDRTVTLERPLFPGYVFVRFSRETRLPVISTPGVLKVLGNRGAAIVDRSEVDRIRNGLANGYMLRPHTGISTGTRVRVCRGMFEGMEGIVSELRRNCNVIIRLSAVEQYFSLEAALSDLEVLGKPVTGAAKQPHDFRQQVQQFRVV